MGFSDGQVFGKPYVQHVVTMGCLAGSKDCIQRLLSEELLWYVTASDNASVWHRYNVSAKAGDEPVHLVNTTASKRLLSLGTAGCVSHADGAALCSRRTQ